MRKRVDEANRSCMRLDEADEGLPRAYLVVEGQFGILFVCEKDRGYSFFNLCGVKLMGWIRIIKLNKDEPKKFEIIMRHDSSAQVKSFIQSHALKLCAH